MSELILTLLTKLGVAIERAEEAEAKAARLLDVVEKQQRHLLRLTKVCDEFHTGEKAPRAIAGSVTNEFVLREKPSYNELARFHENQRTVIGNLQARCDELAARTVALRGKLDTIVEVADA